MLASQICFHPVMFGRQHNPRIPLNLHQRTGVPGMNIVHPPYATSEYWLNKIDNDKVDVPTWVPLNQLHPCDFQTSMLKGCIPPSGDSDADNIAKQQFYSTERRRAIRRIYLAMIAE